MTCTCDYAPKTFHCPYCKRDVCLCEACYLDNNTPPLCMWCADTANDWPAPNRELLRRELAYYQSGKAEDASAIDELLVRPRDLRWNMHQNGDVWVLSNNYRNPVDGRAYGRIWWSGMGDGVRQAWPASLPFAIRPLCEGTITDCARALVKAVTK